MTHDAEAAKDALYAALSALPSVDMPPLAARTELVRAQVALAATHMLRALARVYAR